jgi:hypothetical protein
MPQVKPIALLEGRLGYAYVDDVSVTVFTVAHWSDADLVRMLEDTTRLGQNITATGTVSHFYGEVPGAHHRKLIVKWLTERGLPSSPRNALLTDSQLMRGALTAFAWLTQAETRAFEPTERDAMCTWIARDLVTKPANVRAALEECYRLVGKPVP